MSAVTVNDDGLVLRLYIQPKASRDSIVGLHGDEVKVVSNSGLPKVRW